MDSRYRRLAALSGPLLINLTLAGALRLLLPANLDDSGERYRYVEMSLIFPLRHCPSFHCFRFVPPLLTSLLPLPEIPAFMVTGVVFLALAGTVLWHLTERVYGSRYVALIATGWFWATWGAIQSLGDPLLITDPVQAFWSLGCLYLLMTRRYGWALAGLISGATVKENVLVVPMIYAAYVLVARDKQRPRWIVLFILIGLPIDAWLIVRFILTHFFQYVSYEDADYLYRTYFFWLWLPNLSWFPKNLLIAALYIFSAFGLAWIFAGLEWRDSSHREQKALALASAGPMLFLALYQVPDRALASFPWAILMPAAAYLSRLPAPVVVGVLVANAAFSARMANSVPWLPRLPILLSVLGLMLAAALYTNRLNTISRASEGSEVEQPAAARRLR